MDKEKQQKLAKLINALIITVNSTLQNNEEIRRIIETARFELGIDLWLISQISAGYAELRHDPAEHRTPTPAQYSEDDLNFLRSLKISTEPGSK